MIECVVNISEGRRLDIIEEVVAVAGAAVLDVHSDPHHNRTVVTLVGEDAPRAVTRVAVARLDLRTHEGAHPRLGVVDVVPFVPLGNATMADATGARNDFLGWLGRVLGVPGFAYGPERSLPELRRRAFSDLRPDAGPATPHPTAGATAVGARGPLVAWNLWLAEGDVVLARRIARAIRGPSLRALGLAVGAEVQVSMNLIDPLVIGPAEAWDLVAEHVAIERAELVGLVPRAVLDRTDRRRWVRLDLDEERTIESRLARSGLV